MTTAGSIKGMLDDAGDAAEKLRAQLNDLADITADDGLPHGYRHSQAARRRRASRLRELHDIADDLANGIDRLSTEMRS